MAKAIEIRPPMMQITGMGLVSSPGITMSMMGGYYDVRAGYGPRYAMNGYLQLTIDNEINALSAYVPGWGDTYDEFYDGSYDPETQTVTFDIDYGGSMQFHIILQ